MTTETRALTGPYEPRFHITRTDGKPIDPSRRYMVLSFDGSDKCAREALYYYAGLIAEHNPELASTLRTHLDNPEDAPSQHS